MSGKKPVADKSKFMQTCNRLSLFLKDLNYAKFNATGALESTSPTTIDLLSNIDDEAAAEKPSLNNNINLPEYFVLDSSSSCEVKNCRNKLGTSSNSKSAQMTIFYRGQVVVLDDVPEDRTRDLILMANNIQPNQKMEKLPKSPPSEAPAAVAKDKDLESDLPIARRASLHKFLAKRKDRRTTPYQPPGLGGSFDLNR